jgi:hypothetical protein
MTDVIPQEVLPVLSEFELALLVLSAYLHDIGMTPERGKVKQVFRYLETGDEPSLALHEKESIQEWLDNASAGVPGRVRSAVSKGSDGSLELLVAHYCRHKHNDWSEDWIRKNLSHLQWHGYVGWMDDLVELCRSHHYGYFELRQRGFDPKATGVASPPRVVHRRYLACVLRISDILEFDPERTPDIVFTHRSIARSSEIFWHRDHYIQLVIDGNPKRIFISAEPSEAKVHRAIIEMVDQIDAELMLCRRLDNEAPFEKFGPLPDLKHRWDLPPVVDRKIEPKANTYIYIDGAFRPNTQKLLELLSGQQLYGSNFAAVRELLQNAFDATKELIAREILNSENSSTSGSVASDRHVVDLSLGKDSGRMFLTCHDRGVGMTRQIIENYFLVSGSPKRHDILDLERRCEKRGLRLGRTGQFGIGVLSYFMIADQVTILTRRHNSCDDSEPNGWAFETEGVGGFGELRKIPPGTGGTQVRLRLRDEISAGDPARFFEEITSYVRRTVVRAPCVLRLHSDFLDVNASCGPGWLLDRPVLTDFVLKGLEGESNEGPPPGALPAAKRRDLQERSVHWEQVKQEAIAALRWHTFSGDLPSNEGAYRVSIPFFELAGGNAFAFLRTRDSDNKLLLEQIGHGRVYIPRGRKIDAWRGMEVKSKTYEGSHLSNSDHVGVWEVDWEAPEAGSVSVNRNDFLLSEEAKASAAWLAKRVVDEYGLLAERSKGGFFSSLNYRLLGEPPPRRH